MENIETILKNYEYPGRGIIIGLTENKNNTFLAYFIMGRSENSKNRVFKLDEDNNLITTPFNNKSLKNKDLIIYKATAKFENNIIITNGCHTNTILENLKNGSSFKNSFKDVTYEEDPPIFTPRISAILNFDETKINYTFSIIKNNSKNENSPVKFFYEFPSPLKGMGHLIHTYKPKDEDLTNSFYGEPTQIKIPKTFKEFTNTIWDSLNKEFKISLFTLSLNNKTKEQKFNIINKNKEWFCVNLKGVKILKELKLKYGCNPHQVPALVSIKDEENLPIKILNGNPGYINLLDAFNSWQLVKELKTATKIPAAASFKHLSPAGAALGIKMPEILEKVLAVEDLKPKSEIAIAYAKARGIDRMSSYGDWAALSNVCDEETALILKREVSDGIIAPGFTEKALEILKTKKRGKYNIIEIDENYVPKEIETREVFGVSFTQKRNDAIITEEDLKNIVTENKNIPDFAKIDLILASLVCKYTQSNSVCYAKQGMAIGIGAGQQSRIHCTRLAGNKADSFFLRQHEKVLNLPFAENIKRAEKDNAIDVYINEEYDEIIEDETFRKAFLNQKF